ncbi:MAG: TonB-dependent receptor [Acidobacteriota bacterium]|nr:TonB-dependent receptor [Acidobacteriota bacterium]
MSGRVTSGATPLPGVALVVTTGTAVAAATSTEPDGTYQLALPAGTYQVKAELTGFVPVDRAMTLTGDPCGAQVADLQLALQPRAPRAAAAAPAAAGRGRFETLNVQTQQGAAAAEAGQPERETIDAATRLLLPPGFSTEGPTESLAVSGNMAGMDRGMLGERFEAMGRGEIDPVTGELTQGFGPPGQGGRGGPGGGRGGAGGPGGRGGRGDFQIGGRGARQRAYNVQANYNFSGSPLESDPYQLRPGNTPSSRSYNRQSFGFTVGGPVRLPGYNGQRRTTFTATYNGNRGDQLFDQYATVPTEAMRSGDFSSLSAQLFDPATGQSLENNRIPAASLNAGSVSLLRFIPLPNLDGTSRNFRYTTTTDTVSDNVNLRVTHNFTQAAAGRGGPGGRGGAGGGRGGAAGRGGRANQGVSVVMNAQLQYRRNDNEQNNVFPTLGGTSTGSSLSTPVSFNIMRRRTMHNVNLNFSRSTSGAQGRYSNLEDVAGNAGITGISTDPLDWGVPTLSFSSLTSVRDVSPNQRTDTRFTAGYTLTQPWRAHTLRIGGDVRIDQADSRSDANARGAYTFTGLYSSGGSAAARGGGLDFADFLLGLPQQATVQYGPGEVQMAGRSLSLFVQDDWRKSAALTFNLGLRYELLWPFYEANGQMANLDVPADFSAAAAVLSGQAGPFTGAFPTALLRADTNNLAPRVGFAWRAAPGTVVRGGYGISFNAGSYASIARQMVAQPPFAVTDTQLGTATDPLTLQAAFAGSTPDETKNNYGVDKDYDLGLVQTANVDLSKDLRQVWNVGASFTRTRGSSLDIVRAPNRGPDGLRIPDVQPFLWQTSDGSSVLNALALRVRRRPVRGLGGGISYTLAKSRDNASTVGGGGTIVAQNDQDLDAEWGLSSFDRRHQFAADTSIELPFGANRRWLNNGGVWARLLENWRATATFTRQSGTPYTPRVQAAAADVARGVSGTLRANYSGQDIQLNDPAIDLFFNTAAFTVPSVGTFGSASRNLIIGPGSRQLDAQFSRDVRLGSTRVLSINLNATNLLNMVNYAAIDTVVNSPTFGQVTSVRPMRAMQLGLRFRF